MKEYTSVHQVSFADVVSILEAWEHHEIEEFDVEYWAECIIRSRWYYYELSDPKSILREVISRLALIYMWPILRQDIPVLKAVLQQAQISPVTAWDQLHKHDAAIDWDHRAAQVIENIRKYHNPLMDTITDR